MSHGMTSYHMIFYHISHIIGTKDKGPGTRDQEQGTRDKGWLPVGNTVAGSCTRRAVQFGAYLGA